MAIFLIRDDATTDPNVKVRTSGSQAYTRGDMVMCDRTSDGTDVIPATASSVSDNLFGIAAETIASTVTTLLVTPIKFSRTQIWGADSTNNSNSNHRYQRMVVGASARIINNTGTDVTLATGVFTQTGELGAASAKQITGYFNVGAITTASA